MTFAGSKKATTSTFAGSADDDDKDEADICQGPHWQTSSLYLYSRLTLEGIRQFYIAIEKEARVCCCCCCWIQSGLVPVVNTEVFESRGF